MRDDDMIAYSTSNFGTPNLKKTMVKCIGLVMFCGFTMTSTGCFEKPKGTVQISSAPSDLKIYVNGTFKGNTSNTEGGMFSLDLVEGEHKIDVVNNINQFEEFFEEKSVLVTADTQQAVHFKVETNKRVSEEGHKNREIYLQACDKGETTKCVDLANHYLRDKENLKEVALSNTLFDKACKSGHWSSCHVIASNYAEGLGFEKDIVKANKLDLITCENGFLDACASLGLRYFNDPKIEDHINKSRLLLDKACAGGGVKSCTNLGSTYLTGKQKDISKAIEIMTKSCDTADIIACNTLGEALEKRKIKMSKKLYTKACDLGNQSSCDSVKRVEKEIRRRAERARMGNCKIGGTVYPSEEWSSTTSSGNVFADAFFGAATKETFTIVYEGVVKAIVGKKAEVVINDYRVKQTKGGGFLQPRTLAKHNISKHADKFLGKTQFYDKSVCD